MNNPVSDPRVPGALNRAAAERAGLRVRAPRLGRARPTDAGVRP